MLQRMGGGRRELSVGGLGGGLHHQPADDRPGAAAAEPAGRPARRDGPRGPDRLLPGSGLGAAAVLRQLGLAYGEGGRLRTLAPVREHVAATHPPEPADLDRAVGDYARLAATTGRRAGHRARAPARRPGCRPTPATSRPCWSGPQQTAGSMNSLTQYIGLARYWRYTGFAQPALAKVAEQAIEAHGTPFQRARTWKALRPSGALQVRS